MNFIFPDHLKGFNDRKIEQDRVFILKEEWLKSRSALHIILHSLGGWMISRGKQLHARYSMKTQPRSMVRLRDASKIFRA